MPFEYPSAVRAWCAMPTCVTASFSSVSLSASCFLFSEDALLLHNLAHSASPSVSDFFELEVDFFDEEEAAAFFFLAALLAFRRARELSR